jgi:DNA polymerase V
MHINQVSLKLMKDTILSKKHGGKRAGAGRKPGINKYGEQTSPIRVPTSLIPKIKNMLNNYGSTPPEFEEAFYSGLQEQSKVTLPFFEAVPAGFPSPASDYVEGSLDINEHLIRHPSATFLVRVTGESMTGAGIFPNDILVVDRSLEAKNKNIVIAVIDGELTVKRFYNINGSVKLKAENPKFESVAFIPSTTLEVWGVVSGVIRKL